MEVCRGQAYYYLGQKRKSEIIRSRTQSQLLLLGQEVVVEGVEELDIFLLEFEYPRAGRGFKRGDPVDDIIHQRFILLV